MFATWDLAAEQISENLAKGETSIDVDRTGGNPQLRGDHRHRAALPMTVDDQVSTMNGGAGILVRVVHPSGSSAGVWRLQPNSEPVEQPTESSQLGPDFPE